MTEDAHRYRIEPLSPAHDRFSFACGSPALNAYLQKQARQDMERKLATVLILTADGTNVAGFYTLSACSIQGGDLPAAYAKKLPRLPIPATLLGRMAIHSGLQGNGLGRRLLTHALERAWRGSQEIGSWAVIVDAKEDARSFYLGYQFIPFVAAERRLFLPMHTIAKLFTPQRLISDL